MSSLRTEIRSELFPGIIATLDMRDDTQRWTYWFGSRFETPTPQILTAWAKKSDHFFDVGANYGFFSFMLLTENPNLRVHSFEPNPTVFTHLQTICQSNHLSSITPHPFGLADSGGKHRFYPLHQNTGHSSFAPVTEDESVEAAQDVLTIETQRFDDFVERAKISYPKEPTWVAKIDVEGFEHKVLFGMSESLKRKAFVGVCVEILPENLALTGTNETEIDSLLRSVGYQRMTIEPVLTRRYEAQHNRFYVPYDSSIEGGRSNP